LPHLAVHATLDEGERPLPEKREKKKRQLCIGVTLDKLAEDFIDPVKLKTVCGIKRTIIIPDGTFYIAFGYLLAVIHVLLLLFLS
jgi:hypothetical protein